MVCDQDIAKETFVKEDFDEVHFKFETQELNNMNPLNSKPWNMNPQPIILKITKFGINPSIPSHLQQPKINI